MNYTEFRKTYNWMVKNYPQTDNAFCFFESAFMQMKKTTYKKSGSKWFEVSSENWKDIDGKTYANMVDAVPFFRGLGGYERISCGYTRNGYIPTEVISISPDRKEKHVYRFRSI